MDTMTTAATVEPVTVTELAVNTRLIVDDTTDYTGPEAILLARLISAAREAAEDYTQRIFCEQFRALTVDSWNCAVIHHQGVSVDSVTYIDPDEVQQVLDAGDYRLHRQYNSTTIKIKGSVLEPDLLDFPGSITINYRVGASTAADVPQKVRHAIILLASYWFENREAAVYTTSGGVKELPLTFTDMLDWKHRIDSFA